MLKIYENMRPDQVLELRQMGQDQILITGLLLKVSIGIFPHEYEQKQCVEIDLIIDINSQKQLGGYDKANIVRYDHIVADITQLVSDSHFELVETLAEAIAQTCLKNDGTESVCVTVKKLDAIKTAKAVGVRIRRCRLNS